MKARLLCLLFVLVAVGGYAAPALADETGVVTRVIDGDTIDVQIGNTTERVRYIGVDTPETVNPNTPVECYGREASARNSQLVSGQTVRLEADAAERDRFGRLLRYVWLGSEMVNFSLIRDGFGTVLIIPPNSEYEAAMRQLEAEAKAAARGLWGACAGLTPQAPAVATSALNFPESDCSGPTATVTFSWTPVQSATQYWVDLSTQDNGFASGTFVGSGPHGPGATSFVWPGIHRGLAHLWRVNALTPLGWVTSETGVFVPCGGPVLLFGPLNCTGSTTATVNFRWAPPSSPGIVQFIDLSTISNGFLPGTFINSGPLAPTAQSHSWPGIRSGVTHYFRINVLTILGWSSTVVASFTPQCGPPPPPPVVQPPPTPRPPVGGATGTNCHPSYPTVCIPPPPPDLDCNQIPYRRFPVVGSDPHRFDGDNDGIGCET